MSWSAVFENPIRHRRILYSKFGLGEDPRGLKVLFRYKGQDLLGEVVEVERDFITGAFRLQVKHFDGTPWPVSPAANLVEVLT